MEPKIEQLQIMRGSRVRIIIHSGNLWKDNPGTVVEVCEHFPRPIGVTFDNKGPGIEGGDIFYFYSTELELI